VIEKANTLNSYYSTVFSSEGNNLHIKGENTGDPFTSDIKIIRKRINLLDPELFFLVLAHPVYKMRIIQEPNKIEL